MSEADALRYNPFEGDFGNVDDRTFSDKFVVARRPGPCHLCTSEIKPGERIRRRTDLVDGKVESYRWCSLCCDAMATCWTDEGKALEARYRLRPNPTRDREVI